jgi:iron-sulfur cluster protein
MTPQSTNGPAVDSEQNVASALLGFQKAWRTDRGSRIEELDSHGGFASLRHDVATAKQAVRSEWSRYIETFTSNAQTAGATVVVVATAKEANNYVIDVCRRAGATLAVKGKSMATEEIGLNSALEEAGIVPLETDLGEWLVQLAGDHPSHLVMPAIHMRRHEVADLLESTLGRPFDADDIPSMVHAARTELREDFGRARVGVTGANALVADTGTVVIVCNEGNNRMSVALPKTHIVVAGIEKLVGSFSDAMNIVRLLPRSATGQVITTYTNFITGPRPGQDQHIVLIDNGRTEMAGRAEFADALSCIRCGACANVCPAFQVAGGHTFGHIYTGPIGLVITPFHHGIEAAAAPQELCLACGACTTVCPAEIPLAEQILTVRRDVRTETGGGHLRRLILRLYGNRRLFGAFVRVGSILTRPFARGQVLRLPFSTRWTKWRSAPAVPPVPARKRLGSRPSLGGDRPKVGVLLQCLSDRIAPDIAVSTVKLLEAAGYDVEIPESQHCCGLPAYDGGEWDIARTMARDTLTTFAEFDIIVTPAPSCVVAMAHEYKILFKDDPEWSDKAQSIGPKVHDLVSFLGEVAPKLPFAAEVPSEPVTVHRFCQSGNILGMTNEMDSLLNAAGVSVVDQEEPGVCCGFGGSTSITSPQLSQGVAERKLASLEAAGVNTVVTDNPGCVLHLRGVVDAAGVDLDVRHPAEILAERLRS